VPFISSALSVGFCFFILGTLGAFLPDLPGLPVKDFLVLSLPIAMCGEATVAMFADDVAPAESEFNHYTSGGIDKNKDTDGFGGFANGATW